MKRTISKLRGIEHRQYYPDHAQASEPLEHSQTKGQTMRLMIKNPWGEIKLDLTPRDLYSVITIAEKNKIEKMKVGETLTFPRNFGNKEFRIERMQ